MMYLRDFDLDVARARFDLRIDRLRGLVMDSGGPDAYWTRQVRSVWGTTRFGVTTPTEVLEQLILNSLKYLPVESGGTVQAVADGFAALPSNLVPELAFVQGLMLLRAHPSHPGFPAIPFYRGGQAASVPESDIGPLLEQMFAARPRAWSLRAFQETILDGARRVFAEDEVESDVDVDKIYPGSHIGNYMRLLAVSFALDAFGAFDPGFTRPDALAGEWWLLQPVSPRLEIYALASRFGLRCSGAISQAHVDAPGRMVMACFPDDGRTDQQRIEEIEDSKWIAGWKKVLWSRREHPLDDPTFDIIEVGPVDERDPVYRHSSELPPWPG